MEKSYLNNYQNKSELEKLKNFLISTDAYSELLLFGLEPKQILSLIEQPFLENLTRDDVLDRIDKNQYNYQDELHNYGLDIELDAFAYACYKMHTNLDGCESIKKNIEKMKVRG